MSMVKTKVLLLGAGGETGSSILNGLLEYGKNEVIALIRPTSAAKPIVSKLKERGVEVRLGDATDDATSLASTMRDIDIVVSAISAGEQLEQLSLIDTAKQAHVKRFVPCRFITVAPPGGVMDLRDQKELLYQHIRKLFLPYTVIDVGYWYQISFPALPSRKINYAMLRPNNATMIGDGEVKTGITDLRNVGRYVARVINDDRTLNKMVFAFGDILSQREIFAMLEQMSGERIEPQIMTAAQFEAAIKDAILKRLSEPENPMRRLMLSSWQYQHSKYVRGDNTVEYAKYLGYLSAGDLYPEFVPLTFRSCLREVLDGKGYKPYPELVF